MRGSRYESYTFVPLFPTPHDRDAAEELEEAANPDAPCPARVATMPLQGMAFFEAAGERAAELDRVWSERVPRASCPVVLLLDEPGLEECLAGLDAEFVIGVTDGGAGARYAGLPNVRLIESGEAIEITDEAMRLWTENGARCFLPGSPPEADASAAGSDDDLLAALFGEASPAPRPARPDEPPPDPLAALSAATPEAPPEPPGLQGRQGLFSVPRPESGARDWLAWARSIIARHREVAVPDEIGDLLLGVSPSPLVVVGSRKGGVGKTALSAGLAQVCGYSLDGKAGVAGLIDQNINNADQWGRVMVPEGTPTVRDLMSALETGYELPPPPAYARTPALAVYPESRDPGDGYPAALVRRFVNGLRARHVISVVDLPNTLPAYTSAEASVAAAYVGEADLVVVPTTDDPNALRAVTDYLTLPSLRAKPVVVAYIVSPEPGIREDPNVLRLLQGIRRGSRAIVPFPKTEKATLAVVKGTSILDVETSLRNAFIELASTVARVLVEGDA
ncbi:MAG TPA: hypothetical protein VIA06_22910 [Candidatus Dormibacteraeota bacterium]|nr:hypothetical protein [Candidatus Dormibacteraeota bacterium]